MRECPHCGEPMNGKEECPQCGNCLVCCLCEKENVAEEDIA